MRTPPSIPFEEILEEGTEEQRKQAQALMERIS